MVPALRYLSIWHNDLMAFAKTFGPISDRAKPKPPSSESTHNSDYEHSVRMIGQLQIWALKLLQIDEISEIMLSITSLRPMCLLIGLQWGLVFNIICIMEVTANHYNPKWDSNDVLSQACLLEQEFIYLRIPYSRPSLEIHWQNVYRYSCKHIYHNIVYTVDNLIG